MNFLDRAISIDISGALPELWLLYCDKEGRKSERVVTPLRLRPGAEGDTALIAWCSLRDEERSFLFGRILDCRSHNRLGPAISLPDVLAQATHRIRAGRALLRNGSFEAARPPAMDEQRFLDAAADIARLVHPHACQLLEDQAEAHTHVSMISIEEAAGNRTSYFDQPNWAAQAEGRLSAHQRMGAMARQTAVTQAVSELEAERPDFFRTALGWVHFRVAFIASARKVQPLVLTAGRQQDNWCRVGPAITPEVPSDRPDRAVA